MQIGAKISISHLQAVGKPFDGLLIETIKPSTTIDVIWQPILYITAEASETMSASASLSGIDWEEPA